MIDPSKYSLNGVYRCENFAELARHGDFPIVPIGTLGGMDGWGISLKMANDWAFLFPVMFCIDKPALVLRRFFKIIKKDGSTAFELVNLGLVKDISAPIGHEMNIHDLWNEENGYLDDDGALTVEYGIHVDVVLGNDGIRKFNFNDQFFNSENSLQIQYRNATGDGSANVFYAHKQILRFHFPFFHHQITTLIPNWSEERHLEECLQIAHGVRIQFDKGFSAFWILRIAHWNQLRNVVQYVDQQLVEVFWNPQEDLSDLFMFDNCVEFRLRHFLAHFVRQFECLEDLKTMIQKLDIQKMSGEAMKTFVAKVFKLETSIY